MSAATFPWRPVLALAAALAVCLGSGLAVLYAALEPAGRAQFLGLIGRGAPLLVLAWVVAATAAALAWQRWWLPRVRALHELAEQTRALCAVGTPLQLPTRAAAGQQALVKAINALAQQRDALRGDAAAEVARASAQVRQERNRLAALMAELRQSVVVCNADGRILLYNNRARLQFRALSDAPSLAGGAELIGIGRSIYAVLDRRLVAHALDSLQQRLARGAPHPSAQFVTATRGGQLLRAQLAPVTDAAEHAAGGAEAPGMGGFVILLDNITRSFEEETARNQLLHGLLEGSRASLAIAQAALDVLAGDDLQPTLRERFMGMLRYEIGAMVERVHAAGDRLPDGRFTRWPLEDMRGGEFVELAARRLGDQCGVPVTLSEVDHQAWLRLDGFSLLQALGHLAGRLVEELGARTLALGLAVLDGHAQLDLIWVGHAVNTETVAHWEIEPMRLGGETLPLSVRDVLARHGAEMWFERHRASHHAFFRLLLPLSHPAEDAPGAHETTAALAPGRPEFFDFDLFAAREGGMALDDRPLTELVYTVFDTETTGLDPAGGDEIIQLGATRVVNGRLLRHESFEQLIDPGRDIPAAGIRIHGITAQMVAGQPRIEQVLPAFHQFAQDTVLVGHNAAFDLKFFQMLEPRTGLQFHQPVLDTLLLSAALHPHQASHRLEAIAARLGIPVLGRHTALGDALLTAEILLRLIALLHGEGVVTLGQARAKAQATYHARLAY